MTHPVNDPLTIEDRSRIERLIAVGYAHRTIAHMVGTVEETVSAVAGGTAKIATCGWFARCGRPAIGTEPHPVLGKVPVCPSCRVFVRTNS